MVVASEDPKFARNGVAAGDGDVPSIRMVSTVRGADRSGPRRVRVNTTSPPSTIRSETAATVTTGESLRRIWPVARVDEPSVTPASSPTTSSTSTVSSGSAALSLRVSSVISSRVSPGMNVTLRVVWAPM